MIFLLVKQMSDSEGITEQLKVENSILYHGLVE